jgi:hypothetical protein
MTNMHAPIDHKSQLSEYCALITSGATYRSEEKVKEGKRKTDKTGQIRAQRGIAMSHRRAAPIGRCGWQARAGCCLFFTYIIRRSRQHLEILAALHELAHTEINDFDHIASGLSLSLAEEEVVRLEVTVRNRTVMHMLQTFDHLAQDRGGLFLAEGPGVLDAVKEFSAFRQFEHQIKVGQALVHWRSTKETKNSGKKRHSVRRAPQWKGSAPHCVRQWQRGQRQAGFSLQSPTCEGGAQE